MEDFFIKWQAPEYHDYQRSVDWYWAVAIITISISILAFVFGNALFGIIIIISAVILIFFTLRQPQDINYEINKKGILVNNNLYPYLTLEAFWVENRTIEPKIILKSKKNLLPYIVIPIHENDANEITEVLRNFIEEKEITEPISHKIMDYLGF